MYKKKCCDDAFNCLKIHESILQDFLHDPRNDDEGCSSKDIWKRFGRPEDVPDSETFWTHPAADDKDGHYSMYVNALNRLGLFPIVTEVQRSRGCSPFQ